MLMIGIQCPCAQFYTEFEQIPAQKVLKLGSGISFLGLPRIFPASGKFLRPCFQHLLSVLRHIEYGPMVNTWHMLGTSGHDLICSRQYTIHTAGKLKRTFREISSCNHYPCHGEMKAMACKRCQSKQSNEHCANTGIQDDECSVPQLIRSGQIGHHHDGPLRDDSWQLTVCHLQDDSCRSMHDARCLKP